MRRGGKRREGWGDTAVAARRKPGLRERSSAVAEVVRAVVPYACIYGYLR